MKSIAIYCGSSKGNKPAFIEAAQHTGKTFAKRNIELIYGAGNVGLMGEVADATLAGGGKVCGIIPDFLKKWEVCHMGLTELIVTETMHERKQIMFERSDAFIALPGGFGTLDEIFEILTWAQLKLHRKPIGLLNVDGYYDFIIQHVDNMVASKFMQPANKDLLIVDDNLERLLESMEAFTSPAGEKWVK